MCDGAALSQVNHRSVVISPSLPQVVVLRFDCVLHHCRSNSCGVCDGATLSHGKHRSVGVLLVVFRFVHMHYCALDCFLVCLALCTILELRCITEVRGILAMCGSSNLVELGGFDSEPEAVCVFAKACASLHCVGILGCHQCVCCCCLFADILLRDDA